MQESDLYMELCAILSEQATLENIADTLKTTIISPSSLWSQAPGGAATNDDISLFKVCAKDLGWGSGDTINVFVVSDRRSISVTLYLSDIWLTYLPLCKTIAARARSRRLFVALAGCAAAGKTTTALVLQRMLSTFSIPFVIMKDPPYC
jgi:hypothetical protein